MADVSHELGALRFVVESPLSSKVAMFNNAATKHKEAQHLNPFSQAGGLPKPTFNKGEYGKPLAGSLTEMRGQKANIHVLKDMLELCQIIDSEGYAVKDEPDMKVIPFGELFNIYTYISDKVVGILLRARKHKLVEFEGEVLFQRRDDDVPIFLLKPIKEIRSILEQKQDEIRRSISPAPKATSVMMDQQKRGLTPSPTPNKAAKKSDTKPESSGIIKPIALKPTCIPTIEIQSDEMKAAIQNELKVETALNEAATSTQPLEEVSATQTPTAVKEEPLTSNNRVKPGTETPKPETPIQEVIPPTNILPVTIITPPTPSAEASTAATLNEPIPVLVEKSDINNNEDAPAINPATETASNTEVEPPIEGAEPTVPNI